MGSSPTPRTICILFVIIGRGLYREKIDLLFYSFLWCVLLGSDFGVYYLISFEPWLCGCFSMLFLVIFPLSCYYLVFFSYFEISFKCDSDY